MARTEKEMRAKITADDRDFNRKTNRAKKQGKSFGQSMVGVAKMIGAAFVLKKAYDGIKRLIGGMMEMADRLLDLKDITGMSTDELQEWQYVAKIAGVNSEAVANAAQNLTNRFQNLYREQSPISRGFREMGVEAFDAAGELRNTGEIVDELITELAGMESETRRNALGAQLFGGSWKDLAPILGMGAEGIEKLKQEARDLGIVMDEEAIKAADELRQAKIRLTETTGALGREIGTALIPVLTRLADTALGMIQTLRKFAEGVKKVIGDDDMSRVEKFRMILGGAMHTTGEMTDLFTDMWRKQKDVSDETKNLTDETGKLQQAFNENTASIRELDEEIKALEESKKDLSVTDKEEIARINELIERYTEAKDFLSDYRSEIEHTGEAIKEILPPVEEFAHITERTADEIIELTGGLEIVTEEFERMNAVILKAVDYMEMAQEAARRFGEQVAWAAVTGQQGIEDYGRTVANVARDNIKAYLAEAIAATIRAHVGTGPFGIVLAGLAAGAVASMFNTMIPAFAQGGAVSGPTLALVGEGPGVSRSNPEFIGTAKQMGQMGQMSARYLKISKGDLVFAINESQSHSQRSY